MADTVSVTQAVLLRAFKLIDGVAGEINGVPNEPTDDMADDIAMDLAEALGVPFDENWPETAAAALASTQPTPAFPREEVAAIVDPAAWEQRDRHLHKAASAGRRSEALDWLRRADDVVAPSLRAADAVASLLQGKQP